LKAGVAGAAGRWYFGPIEQPVQTSKENSVYFQ
jgi:hypothetical protein